MYNRKIPYTQPIYSLQTDDVIDPEFTYPNDDFNVPATPPSEDTIFDPNYSVTPENNTIIQPGPGNRPPFITIFPQPIVPCLFCSSNQWLPGAIRFLNATVGYNAFNVFVGNQLVYSGLNAAEITRYTRVNPGTQVVSIAAPNGYIYAQKTLRFPDGMSTLAIVNAANGLDILVISDTSCSSGSRSACIRVGNLAYYSGNINVTMGNLIFSNISFGQTANFSIVRNGSYTIRVARSANPGSALLTTDVTLNANRIYTLYIINWNASPDAVQTLLVEDRRN